MYLPIKIVKNPQLKDGGEAISLNDDMKQIYVCRNEEKGWVMLGHDGYKFSLNDERPQVLIQGQFPKHINNNVHARFILNGYYKREENKKGTSSKAKVFYVESYELLDNFDRDRQEG